MAFRLSNNLVGILNFITFLLSIPILSTGIWLSHRSTTDCEKFLQTPIIVIGAFLLIISLAGLFGACCRVNWLLWVYLLTMFVMIVVLFCFTVFTFVVTNKGAGEVVSGRGYKEYRLGDYNSWLQKRVGKNWEKIGTCLKDGKVCQRLEERNQTSVEFFQDDLSPIQSGCCTPPSECNFVYQNATAWTPQGPVSNSSDCTTWSNDQSILCYGCESCKAGVIANLRHDWKKVAVVNIIFLVFLVIVYSVGCCAFRNNRNDNAYSGGGWKGGRV